MSTVTEARAAADAGVPFARSDTQERHNASVTLRHASKWYGNVVAVNDITFELTPGVTGLLGPNGAGKTTLLHLMAGFLKPSSGTVEVDGQPSWKNPEVYRRIGIVPEREDVYPFLTGREFVRMNAVLQRLPDPDEATERAVAAVELTRAADRRIGTYSKGMRQRIKVAGALAHDPAILLLDEPFNGMDPKQRLHMIDLLRADAERGRVIVFSTHILEELHHLAEQVLVVVSGRLAASGDFREIRRLMTDRPHTFTLRSTENRALAAALMADESVAAVELTDGRLVVRAADRGSFTVALPRIARRAGVGLRELIPADESLESVFSYLVER
ncbi:MAG: ABC transporter ATP-binding protein [Gemmatimonadota bacterium]